MSTSWPHPPLRSKANSLHPWDLQQTSKFSSSMVVTIFDHVARHPINGLLSVERHLCPPDVNHRGRVGYLHQSRFRHPQPHTDNRSLFLFSTDVVSSSIHDCLQICLPTADRSNGLASDLALSPFRRPSQQSCLLAALTDSPMILSSCRFDTDDLASDLVLLSL